VVAQARSRRHLPRRVRVSLREVIDHVTIRLPDLESGRRFYSRALELLDFFHLQTEGGGFSEWNDFSISQATAERPATQRLHIAFQAASRQVVDSWWQALTEAGYRDDGAPGPRPQYSPDYYGAFVIDPGGNSAEAVHHQPPRHGGVLDHLWLRVTDLAASTRFYETVAPTVGHQVKTRSDRTTIYGDGASFTLVPGEPTANLHLAFASPDQATVDAFHQAGIDAGYTSLGPPGERPEYHAGYFGAYLADPDGNNIEAVFHDRSL
jgi:catechol 2,3-dioxygenase-like lactoylglutathione lyase family enzyme